MGARAVPCWQEGLLLSRQAPGREGCWIDPDQRRMHEGAVCLSMQCRGEGTLPEPGHGTHSGGTYRVSSTRAVSVTPQGPSAHTAMAALPAPAQDSSHLVLPQEAHVGLGCLLGIVLGKALQWDGAGPGERGRVSSPSSTRLCLQQVGRAVSRPSLLTCQGPPSPALARDNLLSPTQGQVSGVTQPRAHSQEAARTRTSSSA